MYSILALSGDTGCTLGPWVISFMSIQYSQNLSSGDALKSGIGFGALFPALMIIAISLLRLKNSIDKKSDNAIINS